MPYLSRNRFVRTWSIAAMLVVLSLIGRPASAQVVWEACNNARPGFSNASALVALPFGRLFVGSAGSYDKYHVGVFRSDDHGATWRQLLQGVSIYCMAADPLGAIYATSDSILYRSTDDGESWTPCTIPSFAVSIAVGSDRAVYIATKSARVYRSASQGNIWTEVTSVLEKAFTIKLMSAPSGIYAATVHGLYRSTNRGATWTKLPALKDEDLSLIAQTPNGTIYTASHNNSGQGIYHSSDGGSTWTHADVIQEHNQIYQLCTDSSNVAYVLSQRGLCRSLDGGNTWEVVTTSAPNFDLSPGLAATFQTDGSFLYVGIQVGINYSAIAISGDHGQTWSPLPPRSLGESTVHGLYVEADQALVAATDHGLYRTHDTGEHWERLGANRLEHVLSYVRAKDGTLFAAEDTIGLFRSKDDGATWEATDTATPTYIRSLVTTDDGSVYMVRCRPSVTSVELLAGIYRSRSSGDSWEMVSSLRGFFNIFWRFKNIVAYGDTLFMGVKGEGYPGHPYYVNDTFAIYRSTDGGSFWTPAEESTGWEAWVNVNQYTGSIMAGRFWSSDAGETWYTHESSGIVLDPQILASPRALYAFAYSGPPYISMDDGATWDSLATREVYGPRFGVGALDSNGVLYGGSSSSFGVYKTTAPLLAVARERRNARPANAVVSEYLPLSSNEGTTIVVYDLLGVPHSCPVARVERSATADVRALPNGVYVVKDQGPMRFLKLSR